MLHVLVVAPHLPPTFTGGVEVYSRDLARALHGQNHRVEVAAVERVVAGEDQCSVATDDADGYPAHRLTISLRPSQHLPLLTEHPATSAWFERLMRATRPDVVHVHSGYLIGVPALTAAHRAGVPAVVTLHDYWFACPRVTLRHPSGAICSGATRASKCAWCLSADRRGYLMLDRLTGGSLARRQDRSLVWRTLIGGPAAAVDDRRRLLARLLRDAAAVLAPTHFLAQQLAAAGFPAERIAMHRCGIPPMARPTAKPRADRLRLAYIGQLAPHKGVHLLVEAVRALPERPIALDIHGPLTPHSRYVERLRRIAGDDPRITLHGPYQRERLPDLLASVDAVVVPSVWHEVAALVIQEAQMAGVPVVASAMGGSPELVRHDVDGLLFDPARSGALSAQLARLLDEPGLLERLTAATAPPRTLDDDVDALVALYRSVARPS